MHAAVWFQSGTEPNPVFDAFLTDKTWQERLRQNRLEINTALMQQEKMFFNTGLMHGN